jgi:hypothetical protein
MDSIRMGTYQLVQANAMNVMSFSTKGRMREGGFSYKTAKAVTNAPRLHPATAPKPRCDLRINELIGSLRHRRWTVPDMRQMRVVEIAYT